MAKRTLKYAKIATASLLFGDCILNTGPIIKATSFEYNQNKQISSNEKTIALINKDFFNTAEKLYEEGKLSEDDYQKLITTPINRWGG
ncbi:hypothetical protein ACVRW4_06805 [Streptococcus phocae subsp. phocae]